VYIVFYSLNWLFWCCFYMWNDKPDGYSIPVWNPTGMSTVWISSRGYGYGYEFLPVASLLTGGVTPRCYCSSYNTSTVVSTIFIQWWLQYKPNSMKMVFSTNGVGSFWVKLKVWIFELLWTVDHWAQSNFFL
jgi:hypothetical protein